MVRSILAGILMVLFVCTTAGAETHVPRTNTSIKIPAPIKGNLIIYRVGYTQCSMFVSDEGMAKGTVHPSCIYIPMGLVPVGGYKFEVIDVIETTGD
jgi:hypothetical protein